MIGLFTQSLKHNYARNADGFRRQPYTQFTMGGLVLSKSVAGKVRGHVWIDWGWHSSLRYGRPVARRSSESAATEPEEVFGIKWARRLGGESYESGAWLGSELSKKTG